MTNRLHFDVAIIGGGIAGSTTAAALSRRGLSVLVCEAGLPTHKRLAGELLHPPGTASLQELGLLDSVLEAGGVPVYGFVLMRSATDPGLLLSYSEIRGGRPTGIAVEHATFTRALFGRLAGLPGVTVWDETRVLDVDPHAATPWATVRRAGENVTVTARLIISAEGRTSAIRDKVGIACHEEPPFRMVGWKIPNARLPFPGYGHLFVGGKTATLAYQVSRTEARVMFELPAEGGLEVGADLLDAIPRPFRDDLERAIRDEPRLVAKFCESHTDRVTAGRLAVVGDAGGCVHPLIASGMSFCIGDAMRLDKTVGPTLGQGAIALDRGLAAYERSRVGPMRTRTALGPALVDALTSRDPDMELLRHGIFRYWERSQRGRSASMGLLSTRESSMAVMAREYAIVCAHALTGIPKGVVPRSALPRAVRGLAKRTTGYLRQAMNV